MRDDLKCEICGGVLDITATIIGCRNCGTVWGRCNGAWVEVREEHVDPPFSHGSVNGTDFKGSFSGNRGFTEFSGNLIGLSSIWGKFDICVYVSLMYIHVPRSGDPAPSGFKNVETVNREIPLTRKAFNLSHARIREERILVFRRMS